MATIDMRNSDEAFDGQEVAFGGLVIGSPALFVWDAIGSQSNQVRLYGSGITSSGGVPTGGTVNEIQIDIGSFDPIKDVIITGLSVPIVDLIPSDNLFWETVLQNNDTIYAFYGGPSSGRSYAFGDGRSFIGSVGAIASNDTLDATGTPGEVDLYGDYTSVDSATLTAGNDDLLSGGATGQVDGAGDVQFVRANFGDAIVRGGDDVIDVASGSSSFLAGDVYSVLGSSTAGSDVLVTGGDDTIGYRGSGSPNISGDAHVLVDEDGGGSATVSGGSDDITGGDGAEKIAGDVYSQAGGFVDGGDDVIEAGGGNDDIAGDVWSSSAGTFTGGDDVIDGGLGDDTIDGQTGNDTAQFLSNSLGVVVVLDSGGIDGSAVGQGTDVLRDIENVIASTEDDTVTGNGEANVVLGLDGDDSLSGLGGADTLYGWNDNDTLSGGRGADSLYGGAGDDTLVGGRGSDLLDGDDDADWVEYADATNAVTVDLSLVGAQDTGEGLDTLVSVENLTGSGFDDALAGSSSANRIRGLGGLDTLTGGDGADKFDFEATTDSGGTNTTADIIADFEQGSDLIDLRTMDAELGTAGNQAFAFVGTDGFSGEGQVRYGLSADGETTIIQVNTSGNGGVEMTLRLTGAFNLTDLDFLL